LDVVRYRGSQYSLVMIALFSMKLLGRLRNFFLECVQPGAFYCSVDMLNILTIKVVLEGWPSAYHPKRRNWPQT
jgi:hypothetical protein